MATIPEAAPIMTPDFRLTVLTSFSISFKYQTVS